MEIGLIYCCVNDPFYIDAISGNEMIGAVFLFLKAKSFDHIVIFTTPNVSLNTAKLLEELPKRYPKQSFSVVNMPLWRTYKESHKETFLALRNYCVSLREEYPTAVFTACVTSAPPEAQPLWYMLAYSGYFPAHIAHVRPLHTIGQGWPIMDVIDLTHSTYHLDLDALEAVDVAPQKAPPGNEMQRFRETALAVGLVGEHPVFLNALEMAGLLAESAFPILLLGESGSGKDLFAKFIHALSDRPTKPFVTINCAALPEQLAESILFGHQKGAFTGAVDAQTGKFLQADGGTLFLDELGELPLPTQAKLLRVIEDGYVEPIGSKKGHTVAVRIIAATNRDLEDMVNTGRFREDLFFRLVTGALRVPALSERRSDIPLLCRVLLERINMALRTPKRLTSAAMAFLEGTDFHGNVRMLKNTLERTVRLCRTDVIDKEDLVFPGGSQKNKQSHSPPLGPGFDIREYLSEIRMDIIKQALRQANGNRAEAARNLGLTPQGLRQFLAYTDKKL